MLAHIELLISIFHDHISRFMHRIVMEGGDKKFYMGQHRNETYSEVAKKVEFIQWLLAQSDLSMQNQDFITWFNRTTPSKMEVCMSVHL